MLVGSALTHQRDASLEDDAGFEMAVGHRSCSDVVWKSDYATHTDTLFVRVSIGYMYYGDSAINQVLMGYIMLGTI